MPKYGIKVREVLERTVIVKEEDFDKAMQKVKAAVSQSEIVLNADDYVDREIVQSEEFGSEAISEEEDLSNYWHLGEDK